LSLEGFVSWIKTDRWGKQPRSAVEVGYEESSINLCFDPNTELEVIILGVPFESDFCLREAFIPSFWLSFSSRTKEMALDSPQSRPTNRATPTILVPNSCLDVGCLVSHDAFNLMPATLALGSPCFAVLVMVLSVGKTW
jgi:hypothetical protein